MKVSWAILEKKDNRRRTYFREVGNRIWYKTNTNVVDSNSTRQTKQETERYRAASFYAQNDLGDQPRYSVEFLAGKRHRCVYFKDLVSKILTRNRWWWYSLLSSQSLNYLKPRHILDLSYHTPADSISSEISECVKFVACSQRKHSRSSLMCWFLSGCCAILPERRNGNYIPLHPHELSLREIVSGYYRYRQGEDHTFLRLSSTHVQNGREHSIKPSSISLLNIDN